MLRIVTAIGLVLILSSSAMAQTDSISSNIPIIVIDTDSLEILDDPRIVAHMGIIYNGVDQINHISDPFTDYSGKINIEIRGTTSQSFAKKSYSFETQLDNGANFNVSLLGLPEENDWILYGPHSDKTLIRNILSYKLSRELGQYAPRTKLCELLLNGEYRGVYVLVEKIKRDKNRVDIAKLKPDEISGDDVSGGYIIKIDRLDGDSGTAWQSDIGGIHFQYEYPKPDEIVPEQEAYIQGYIEDFEQALSSDHFMDPDLGYRTYIDDSSFVDFFIINELAKNIDAYMLSTFLSKDKDSKGGRLSMGPVWDFNLSFGNASYRDGFRTNGFQVNINDVPWWWDRLLQDSTFLGDLRNRWYSIREKQFRNEAIFGIIDSLAFLLEESQQRNFERWNILGRIIWPNYYMGESYEDEVEILKTWTTKRLQWLDDRLYNWTSMETISMDPKTHVYPNPFSDQLSYNFTLDSPGNLTLTLYNMNGQQVSTILAEDFYPAGSFTIEWQSAGIQASVYVLVLRVNNQIVSRKKVLKLQ